MQKVELKEILPSNLRLDAVYTFIKIYSDILKDENDFTDEDTVVRELINYVIKKSIDYTANCNDKGKRYLLYQLRLLAQDNKLPAKALLYFLDNNYIDINFYKNMDKVLINTDNKELIKKLLEYTTRKDFNDEFGRITDTVRLQIKAGNYKEAIKEFDERDTYCGEEYNIKSLYNSGRLFESDEEILNDKLLLLLNDIKNSEFSIRQKKDFVNHIIIADSVKLVSLDSLRVIEEILGKNEFKDIIYFLVAATAEEKKIIVTYDEGKEKEGHNIHNIRISDTNTYQKKKKTNNK